MDRSARDLVRQPAQMIVRYLLQQREPVRIRQLSQIFGNHPSVTDLCTVIDAFPNNFERFSDGQGRFVKLITTLSLCNVHCSKETCSGQLPECTGLHVCKFYILSNCRFAGRCQYGHDLTTNHNKTLLHQYLLEDATSSDIQFLLTKSNSRAQVLIPKICKFYNVQAGCTRPKCGNLHLCKHYVVNECVFGKGCRRSHNMKDVVVQDVLTKHGIDTKRTPKEILTDLRKMLTKDEDDADSVGSDVNDRLREISLNDDNVTQRRGNRQQLLELPRAHSATNVSRANLQRGLSHESPRRAQLVDRGARPKTTAGNRNIQGNQSRGMSASVPNLQHMISREGESIPWICLYNLCGSCLFKEQCFNAHHPLPFQWMYRKRPEDPWKVFASGNHNQELEITYCDPENDKCFLEFSGSKIWDIDFKRMRAKGGKYEVIRLSTKSRFDNERHPLATTWKWYWKDQMGNWKEYGMSDSGYHASIQSEDIEQEYLAKPEGQMAFATQGHQYILDFRMMVQENFEYKTRREVVRRPEFVDEQTLHQKIRQANQRKTPTRGDTVDRDVKDKEKVPPTWSGVDGDLLDHCQIVEVQKKRRKREYAEIESLFFESMPNTFSITSIERVENGDLWLSYISKHEKMKKRKGKPVKESKLFHGTSAEFYHAICRQGFDFRLSGKSTGALYGKGSYFATTAKYSDAYAKSSERMIFVVRVLIGEYTKGEKSYVRPPSKDPSNQCSDLYDSCVDNMDNPKIFVIFDNSGQVYPEYVIKYTNTLES